MLDFADFFTACTGVWKTERIYHYPLTGDVERSYTEFTVTSLSQTEKQQILSMSGLNGVKVNLPPMIDEKNSCPGFAIAFNTVSETGERVAMSLKALFVPDTYVIELGSEETPPLPNAAVVADTEEIIKGIYLRDEGYSESGAVRSRFTYQPSRQTLEMTTYYNRSVAVDQMRLVAPSLRLRTIITYQRPPATEIPTVINLVGFGMERRQ